jgi:formamidopyrimidine-DNA glycosylase
MPELPEVEALRRGLQKVITGSTVLNVEVLNAKIVSGNGTKRTGSQEKKQEFQHSLENKTITGLERRAKNILINFDSGELLLVHLKMTGQLVFVPNKSSLNQKDGKTILGGHPIEESEHSLPHKHTYIIFTLNNGTLYYNDVRQFGYVLYFKSYAELDTLNHFEGLGVEPFDSEFTYAYFKSEILKKKTSIKKVLLDQSIVVGCGNIYADEVCFASHVLPTRICSTLTEKELQSMYENIPIILDKAIHSGGSSVANYLLADGKRGNYTDYHKVYKREGKKCLNKNCTSTIVKMEHAGRGTHYCPTCQS